jgi:hypothetical protein
MVALIHIFIIQPENFRGLFSHLTVPAVGKQNAADVNEQGSYRI